MAGLPRATTRAASRTGAWPEPVANCRARSPTLVSLTVDCKDQTTVPFDSERVMQVGAFTDAVRGDW
ncbi:hypothetical protein C7S18_07975 [Ahniella affigens]|uniref:Uncharacterized protein n=1 Tax=Ahniella affigens TaxID=2021234 RepID=A0A2P1PQL0_9GAMM|nr:hypothetical protein C7S18_07975 [Ahniella affigens]